MAIAAICGSMAVATGIAGANPVDKPDPGSGSAGGDTNLVPADELPPAPAQPADPVEFEIDRDASGDRYFAGELLVTYSGSATRSAIRNTIEDAGGETEANLEEIDVKRLDFPEVQEMNADQRREAALQAAKQELAASPGVEHVGYNYVGKTYATFNDPLQGFQWGLSQIGANAAWDRSVGGGTTLAVLDSGLDFGHPEFQGAVLAQAEYFCFVCDGFPEDNNGHGSHVAGIASANTNNGFGIAGTSPQSLFLIAKVCEAGPREPAPCDLGAAAQALIDVANFGGVDVANMSLGGPNNVPALENAVNYAVSRNVFVAVATGNEGTSEPRFPAAYPNAFAVGSTNIQAGISAFSNTGPHVDVVAPGGDSQNAPQENIFSTFPQFLGSFEFLSGTSMSTPHVAGAAALLAAQGLNATAIGEQLKSTATDLGPCGADTAFGAGLLDAGAATGATPRTTNCYGPPAVNEDCERAKRKLQKAKRKLRQAQQSGDPDKIKKAKEKLRKARNRKGKACT